VRLSDEIPHTIKWEVAFRGTDVRVQFDADGATVSSKIKNEGIGVAAGDIHVLVLERAGTNLTLQVDAAAPVRLAIPVGDRTPLRVRTEGKGTGLSSSLLCFGNGEGLAPVPELPSKPPIWKVAFSENFAKKESLDAFSVYPAGGKLEWDKENQALLMGAGPDNKPVHAYVLLHKSLPGDLRIRFRGRSMRPDYAAYFGLLISISGRLKTENGYYVELDVGRSDIFKNKLLVARHNRMLKFKEDGHRWMDFQLEKLGGKITFQVEGKETASWLDRHPFEGPAHDLFALYTYRTSMEFKDLVIERNENDPLQPRVDDPVVAALAPQIDQDGLKPPEPPPVPPPPPPPLIDANEF
jgi:hypothetical protein